ncbi:MAG: cystathionine beta-lyase, partial [Candidatus Cloacimonadota bacterium]
LISDEIHADLILNNNKHIPISSLSAEIQDITISMYAPSKTFNVAGLSTCSIIIPNEDIRKNYQEFMDKLGLHLINNFGIDAFIAAYKDGEEWLEQLLDYLWKNYKFVQKYLENNIPQIKAIELEGTYLMWLDCRELKLRQKELIGLFVNKAGLGMNDGTVFGSGGYGFMRLNIGCSRKLLKKALDQLKEIFKK